MTCSWILSLKTVDVIPSYFSLSLLIFLIFSFHSLFFHISLLIGCFYHHPPSFGRSRFLRFILSLSWLLMCLGTILLTSHRIIPPSLTHRIGVLIPPSRPLGRSLNPPPGEKPYWLRVALCTLCGVWSCRLWLCTR